MDYDIIHYSVIDKRVPHESLNIYENISLIQHIIHI